MITIRRAAPSDASDLAELQAVTWRETYPGLLPQPILDGLTLARLHKQWRAQLKALDDDHDQGVFIAERNEEAIGYGTCGMSRGRIDPWDAEINMLYVRASAQGRGAGQLLMAAMARHLLARGMFSAGVWVVRGNGRARRFYERLGGRPSAFRRDAMQGWLIPVASYRWDDLTDMAGVERATGWKVG